MKKIYIKPNTEQVKVQLTNGVLQDDIGIGPQSDRTEFVLGKEQGDFFEDDNFGDLWSDGGDNGNSYDLWNE
jgi:hypothetical protein